MPLHAELGQPLADGLKFIDFTPQPLPSRSAKNAPVVWEASFKPRPVLEDQAANAALSAERDLIVACCEDGTARLCAINEAAGQISEVARLTGPDGRPVHGGAIRTAAWWRTLDPGPQRILIALASDDTTASVWQIDGEGTDPLAAATVKLLGLTNGHTGRILSLAIHPDGHILATGSSDNTARLWKIP